MPNLNDHIAIVTGGTGGIGSATVQCFLEKGAKVVFTDLAEDLGSSLEHEWGSNARFMRHDVTSASDWERIVAFACSEFGTVSILVNNAGVRQLGLPLHELPDIEYQRVVNVNQFGVFLGMKAVVAPMRARGGGSIVNVSSVAGLVGTGVAVAYTASKFAVTGMTKAAAIDLGGFNIRVNSVHPGIIATPMTLDPRHEDARSLDQWVAGFPISRPGKPKEIAEVIAFLASDAASMCTGAAFPVDGGMSAA